MAVISHLDLFDFPNYKAGITEVDKVTKQFAASVDTVIGRLNTQMGTLRAELTAIASILKGYNVAQNGAAEALKSYNKQVLATVGGINELKTIQQGLASVVNINKASVNELKAELKGLEAQYNNLKPSQKDYAQRQQEIKERMAQVTGLVNAQAQALRNAKQVIDAAEGSMKRMRQELAVLKAKFDSMPNSVNSATGALNRNNKEAVALAQKIKQLEDALKNADGTLGRHTRNVGNYSSAIKGAAGSTFGAIGALIGINSAFQALSFVTDINMRFEALNIAIKTITKTEAEFTKTQSFLAKSANDLGLDLFTLTDNFKRFYAASTLSGVSAEQTRDIFYSFSKAFANLKLSNESANNAFVALEQMFSKGKVTAEELRKQLANHLPGAFGLMAQSMGKTTAELDKMMRSGDLITSEVMPAFAKTVEEAYGRLEKLTSLQASINRFHNAMNGFAQSTGLTSFFSNIVDIGTDVLNFFDEADASIQSNAESAKRQAAETRTMIAAYKELQEQGNLNEQQNTNLKSIEAELVALYGKSIIEIDNQTGAYRINIQAVEDLIRAKEALADGRELDLAEKLSDALEKQAKAKENVKNITELIAAQEKQLGVTVEDALETYRNQNKLFVEHNDQLSVGEYRLIMLNNQLKKEKEDAQNAAYAIADLTQKLKGMGISASIAIEKLRAANLADAVVGAGGKAVKKGGDEDDEKAAKKAAAAAEKKRKAYEDSIRKLQQLNKEGMEIMLQEAELNYAKGLIDEHEYQQQKLAIIRTSVGQRLELERKLDKTLTGKGALDLKQEENKAEIDFTKFFEAEKDKQQKYNKQSLEQTVKDRRAAREEDKRIEQEAMDKINEIQNDKYGYILDNLNREHELKKINNGVSFKDEIDYLNQVKDLKRRMGQETADIDFEIAKKNAERKQELTEQYIKLGEEFAHASLTIIQDQFTAASDNRISSLEKEKERELALAGNNAAAKEKIEKDFNKRIAKEKERKAKADKLFNLFQIAIDTAINVVKASNPTFAWMIPFIIASGAVQAAVVAARPIPKFAKGTKSAPEGPAIVGEAGFELIEREGKMFVAQGPTLMDMKGGEKVWTHEESKRMLDMAAKAQENKDLLGSLSSTSKLAKQLSEGKQAEAVMIMAKAMQNGSLSEAAMRRIMLETLGSMPVNQTIFDERGVYERQKKVNEITTYLNKRHGS